MKAEKKLAMMVLMAMIRNWDSESFRETPLAIIGDTVYFAIRDEKSGRYLICWVPFKKVKSELVTARELAELKVEEVFG